MRLHFNSGALRETRWYEYALRFLFGGSVTAAAGLIARKFGPVVGGLFLAFPAIFPAAAALLERHEMEKKERAGKNGALRAKQVTAVDAFGTVMGTVGLMVFAVMVWQLLERISTSVVLLSATVAWFAVSAMIWEARSKRRNLWR